jgi:endoglucanase
MPPTPTSTPEPTSTPISSVTLRRGVNMGNMLEAPNEGEWGVTVQEEYFDLIKEAGFDFVRLPVRWSAHSDETWSYMSGTAFFTIDPSFFARVDEVIGWALERDLAIIIDFHHYEEMMVEPHEERFLFIWRQIAEHYQDYPPEVIFELLNEPTNNINAPLWNIYVHDALKVIRESNPTRTVIFGPVNWNAYDWITTLDVPHDEHIIVTFHYYLPFEFTHQGAEWVAGSEHWLGTTWPDNEERKREITRDFELVAEWAKRHNVRILLGEFGAYSRAPQDSRVRWTEYVAREAERHGFAWSYWEFAAGFGIYDPDAKIWREELLKALIA